MLSGLLHAFPAATNVEQRVAHVLLGSTWQVLLPFNEVVRVKSMQGRSICMSLEPVMDAADLAEGLGPIYTGWLQC